MLDGAYSVGTITKTLGSIRAASSITEKLILALCEDPDRAEAYVSCKASGRCPPL